MSTTPPKLKRATREEAQTAWSRLNAKQRNSVVGRTYQSIIELLDDTGTIALGALLDTLFADRDLRAAHTALKTQFIARPPRDEADQPLMQLCISALPKLRGGDEAQRLQALRVAQVWFEIPAHLRAEEFPVPALEDVVQRFNATRATDRSPEETLAHSKSDALRAAETAQVASARSSSLFHGTQSIRGLDHHGPFLPGQGMDAPLGGHHHERHHDLDETAKTDAKPVTTDAPTQVVALPTLLQWARNPDASAPRLYALLGDSGTGKTSHAQEFARVLNGESSHSDWPLQDTAAEKVPTLPKALFFDLADLSGVPNLEQLSLEEMLVLLLKRRDGLRVQVVADVAPLLADARAGRLIFVFDGLDELLKTDPLVLQKVFEQLIKVVERPSASRTSTPAAQRPPKVIVSCRTHYFRDVETQHSFFLARGRGAVKATDYRVLTLLPWNAELIERYLASRVGAAEAARLLRVIETTYNLKELASRPVLLAMMCGTLEALLARAKLGERIDAAALYSETVAAWIHRDNGKHRLSPAQKPLLMGALATAMSNDGSELWPADRLDQWVLHAVRELFPNQYSPAELRGVQDDLRTATFIVRPDAQQFNFAHRSYGEYFIARFLLEGMSQVADGFWSLATLRAYLPTRAFGQETHDFLLEMWRSDERKLPAQTLKRRADVLRQLLQGGDAAPAPAPTSHAALWQLVRTARWPLAGAGNASNATEDPINLRGLDFCEQRWEGLNFTDLPPLDVRGSSLRGLYALNCQFGEVRCDSATNWSQAVLRDCVTRGIAWGESLRGGLQVRSGTLPKPTQPLPGPWAVPMGVGRISQAVFSSDGAMIVTGADDGVVRLWDARNGRIARTLKGHRGRVTCVTTSLDNTRLASCGDDQTIRLWDSLTESEVVEFGQYGDFTRCIAIAPSGKVLVSGSDDGKVRLWNAQDATSAKTIDTHSGGVSSLAFSMDGKFLAIGCVDSTIRIWNTHHGEETKILTGHGSSIETMTFIPHSETLASGDDNGEVRIWDIQSSQCLQIFNTNGVSISAIAVTSDAATLSACHSDGTIILRDTKTGHVVSEYRLQCGQIRSAAFSPDSQMVVVVGPVNSESQLWDLNGTTVRSKLVGHGYPVTAVTFSSDGWTIASGSHDETARLWDVRSGTLRDIRSANPEWVRSVALSPDGHTLAVASADGTVSAQLLSGNNNTVLSAAEDSRSPWGLTFSPSGKVLACSFTDGSIRQWDVASGRELPPLTGHGGAVTGIAFSRNGSILASGSADMTIRVWDTKSGRPRRTIFGHYDTVTSVAFSPDGSVLASASGDGTLRLWNSQTWEERRVLSGHRGWIRCVNYSRDGSMLVSGGIDGTVRLWDAVAGKELGVLSGHDDSIWSVAFSPDDRTVASASHDGTMRLWYLGDRRDSTTAFCRVLLAHPRPPFSPSWAEFNAAGELLRWSDNAPDHWLFRQRNGRSEPIEAAL